MKRAKGRRPLFFLLLWAGTGLAGAQAPAPQTVAVMEFAATRTGPDQAENEWLTKGLSDLLIGDLGQATGLRVVTREHALMLAEEAGLRAELADRAQLPQEEARKLTTYFKVDRAVFGTYTIEGDRITLQAQVIGVSNGTVMARFAEEGALSQALDVEKGLARKIMAFFSGKDAPVAKAELPKWTDSTAAAKRLYEGVGAFDAGQYNLAWYRFRQALKTDPNYADARYWGARMYYYRQEYDHARIEYQRFVNDYPMHGRVGDAVMEYVHTQEGGGCEATNVLNVYRAFRERGFQNVEVHNQVDYVGTSPLSDWLLKREQQALVYLGRLGEAYSLLGQDLRNPRQGGNWQDESRNLMSSIAEKAEDEYGERLRSEFVPYKDIELTIEHPEAGEDLTGQPLKGLAYRWGTNYRILAPPSYAFKTVKAHVISTGDPAFKSVSRLSVRRYRYVDINPCWVSSTNPEPRLDHVVNVTMPPGCTWFYLRPEFDGRSGNSSPRDGSQQKSAASFDGWRVEAECVPAGNGRVHLEVTNTHEFRVLVDGIYTRCYNGSLGAISAGEHKLRVESMWAGGAWGFAPFETNLTVTAGQTQRLRLDLRLANAAREAGWQEPVGIALDYPTFKHRPRRNMNWRNGPPSIAVNARTGVRVALWAHLDDLWVSVSTNGTAWTAPDTLPSPVNSAHVDINPRLILDDRDRYCLLFLSDRGQERNLCAYASWSRDLKAWSRPVQVSPAHYSDLDLIQDAEGQYVLACALASDKASPGGEMQIRTSRDLVTWPDSVGIRVENKPGNLAIRQDADGEYHLVWSWAANATTLAYSHGPDLRKWSPTETIPAQLPFPPMSLSMEVMGDVLVVASCTEDLLYNGAEVFALCGRSLHTNKPAWKPMVVPAHTIVGMPSLASDATKTNLLLSWQVGDLFLNPSRSSGPVYVMAGHPPFAPDPDPIKPAKLNQVASAALKKLTAGQSLSQKERDDCHAAYQEYYLALVKRVRNADNLLNVALVGDSAEHYVQALKMAVIDPERHGGWPYRHAAIKRIYPVLQKQAMADTDPVRLAAVIIPAIVNGRTDEAVQTYQWLVARDRFWSGYIVEVIRKKVDGAGDFLGKIGAAQP